jgi:ApaG protein
MNNGHSDVTTEGIRIRVGAQYLPNQSNPDNKHYAFAYRVRIQNLGESSAKLLSRTWIILDADNDRRVVKGPGVVGEQPNLEPGEGFEYTSGSSMPTEWGTMEGSFHFQREGGEEFDAPIGRFFLTPAGVPLASVR